MKISVKTNQNIIFFEVLISLLNNDRKIHPLGEKIIEEFKDIRKTEAYNEFRRSIEKKKIPSHPWQYIFLSVNLNDSLTTKPLSPNDGFGPNRVKSYNENIFPIVSRIHTKVNFEGRYKTEILPEYELVVKDIQQLFNKDNPAKVLKDFWGDKLNTKLIFIPDPLRVGGGSGVSRGKQFYSVTGTVETDKGIVFKPSHMISNLLHEYSHSFFKKYLYHDKEIFEKNEKTCNVLSDTIEREKDNEIFKNYGTSTIYFEETFIRAVQIFLSKNFFEKILKKDMEDKALEQLTKRCEEGFIYIENFYKELNNNENPISSYFRVLKRIESSIEKR